MQRKLRRLQTYGEILVSEYSACKATFAVLDTLYRGAASIDFFSVPGITGPAEILRNCVYKDALLSLYVLLFDKQKEQRSISCQNVYTIIFAQQKEKTKELLKRNWKNASTPDREAEFETLYAGVEREGAELLESPLQQPLKMVRDKILTHHEIKTEGNKRRVYNFNDFPEINPAVLRGGLESAGTFIDDLSLLLCLL